VIFLGFEMYQRKNWIIINSKYEPYPLTMGSCQRIWQLSTFLRRYFKVGLIVNKHEIVHRRELEARYDGVWCFNSDEFAESRHDILRKIWRTVVDFLNGKYHYAIIKSGNDYEFTPSNLRQIRFYSRIYRKYKPIAVIAEYVWAAVPALPVADYHGIRTIIDTHDVLSRRSASQIAAGLHPQYRISEAEEIRLLSVAHAVLAIQPEEAGILSSMLPCRRIILAEHPVQPDATLRLGTDTDVVLFVGSQAQHNVDGIVRFLEEQWPQVLKLVPSAHMRIVGGVCESLDRKLHACENVDLVGVVDDLGKEYSGASIVIYPARFGSGLKIKSVEALAHGKMLVSTPIGVEGLAEGVNSFVLTPFDKMGGVVATLLKDPTRRAFYEKAAFEYAQQRFSPERCFAELYEYIKGETLAEQPAVRPPARVVES
jgi:glycosyltransferase involved in cell wall biosynthesis